MTWTRTAGEAVWVGRFDVGSPAWHAARRQALGGSEIAAVVGLAPPDWSSRFALWHYKAGLIPPDDKNTFKMTLGRVLEDAVIELHTRRNGGHVQRTGMWHHKDRHYQVSEPDRFKVPAPKSHKPYSLIEAKTADSGDSWKWGPDGGSNDDAPPYYVAQTLWYLDTFGFQEGTLAVLIGAREYREYTIRHSSTDCAWLRDEAEAFLDSIRRGEAPPIDGAEATYNAVRQLHPEIDGGSVELPHHLAQEFADAKTALKDAETIWTEARGKVDDFMDTARTAWCNGVQVAIRKAKGQGTPWVEAARGIPQNIPTEKEETAE